MATLTSKQQQAELDRIKAEQVSETEAVVKDTNQQIEELAVEVEKQSADDAANIRGNEE